MRALRLARTALATAVVLAASLAACGDDDNGDTTTGGGGQATAAPAEAEIKASPPDGWGDGGVTVDAASLECGMSADNPTRGITDTEIKIGGLGYLTSPNGSSMAGADLGAKARFDRANDEGGINGRRINFMGMLDDGNDAARNASQARVLVEQEQVFAVVPVMASYANYVDTMCSNVVPFFGWGFNPGFCGNTIGFGITGCLVPEDRVASATMWGVLVQALFPDGQPKVALIGSDTDSSVIGIRDMEKQVEALGFDLVYAENPVPTAGITDTTPVVNDLMTAADGGPPDIIIYATDFGSTNKLIEALAAAGYPGRHLTTVGYDPRLAAAGLPSMQGVYSGVQWSPAEADAPAVQQLVADIERYAPDAVLSLPTMAGYWAADMFVRAATEVGPDLTVDALLELLNDDYTHYVEGAVAETRFPLNHVISAPCGSVVQLNGNAYDIAVDLTCGSLVKE
ncbi:MAG: ABC transporter substrate-binding protein [Frankia sp.]|nr:ABC transporter substrate-binding protein [Frankia sp.]